MEASFSGSAPLEELNEPQARAAAHVRGPLVIFAGAGSGKTRVITYRIANLVAVHRVPPYRILAVTFTNKAAGEMKRRLDGLIGPELARDLWVGTFHAVCARLLRRYGEHTGLEKNFVIYDDSDQRAVMNRVAKELDLDDKRYPPRQILSLIHKEKQEGRGPSEFVPDGYIGDVVGRCFHAYERHLRAANAVDFDDLLLHVLRLAEDVAGPVGRELRGKFRFVLVDEFQDVNLVQYRLVRALVAFGEPGEHNLCVVGDDDQSIYRWRGADVRIMRGFRRDFPDAEIVKLEENYRSSGNIVKAALGVIRPAADREPKELFTARPKGEPIVVAMTRDERHEAAFVVERIQEALQHGARASDVAIFYRVHAQSRVLEEVLRAERIPYQVIGGMRFFERAEIKDVCAYLRVIDNPRSDVDLLRIINVPSRKIGDSTVDKLVAEADARRCSVYDAIVHATANGSVGTAAKKALLSFRDLLEALMAEARTAPPAELAEEVLERSGYKAALADESSTENEARLLNLQEFIGSISDYEEEAAAAGEVGSLRGYLERISLVSDADTIEDAPKVAMMTVHAAKGLEFHTVLLTGMEEDIFPFKRGGDVDDVRDARRREEIEEERRLAYVAVTRARERLYISHAEGRTIFGQFRYCKPSRFLRDLPPNAVHTITTMSAPSSRYVDRARTVDRGSWSHPQASRGDVEIRSLSRPSWRPQSPPDNLRPGERFVEREDGAHADEAGGFRKGARVQHAKYGSGVLEGLDSGEDPTATVRFPGRGSLRIKARFLTID